MSGPRGDLSSISRYLRRLARYGDVAQIRDYVRGDAFLAAFNGLDPERRQSAMLQFAEAHATCEAKAKPNMLAKLDPREYTFILGHPPPTPVSRTVAMSPQAHFVSLT